jgi:hypothetical protein
MSFVCDHANVCGTVKSTFDANGKVTKHSECPHNEPHNDKSCANRNLVCSKIAPAMARCVEIEAPVVERVVEVTPVEDEVTVE